MTLHAAFVGVSYQGDPAWNHLPYARNDAIRIFKCFEAFSASPLQSFLAVEPEFTQEQLLKTGLERFFAGARAGDDVLFVFEGHGYEHKGRSYLAPHSHGARCVERAISFDYLLSIMGSGAPRNVILLIDACHSGQGRMPQHGIGQDVFLPPRGVSILSACDVRQTSLECKDTGGGVFTAMVSHALNGAAGTADGANRLVTVSGLFQFVAAQVPRWIAANRRRLKLRPAFEMTPRFVSDLSADPVLTAVPWVRRTVATPRSLATLKDLPSDNESALTALEALARTAARRAAVRWSRAELHFDVGSHIAELTTMLGRCAADAGIALQPAEMFVLRAAATLHDLGLLEATEMPLRVKKSAQFIRAGQAADLPIPLPDDAVREAVARAVEAMARPGASDDIAWDGTVLRVRVLGALLSLSHRLSVIGDRCQHDVQAGEASRLWVRRPLIAAIDDWGSTGTARAYVTPGVSAAEREVLEGWRTDLALTLRAGTGSDLSFGPRWIELMAQT